MAPVRDYRRVTLYVARTKGTGKCAMLKDGVGIIEQTRDAILSHYGDQASQRRVLAIVDKDSEEKVRGMWATAGFAAFDVAHWNAIDGRNVWRDYDTIVVINLPWAKASLDLSTYMAVHGVELDDEGLNAPPDEVKVIRESRIAAALGQAMGRIRLRRMVSAEGTCEPCDIFVRFPHWSLRADTDRMVERVQDVLTGIQVLEWAALSTKLIRPRPSAAVDGTCAALLDYVQQIQPGTAVPVSEIRRRIGATAHGTWFRVQKSPAVTAGLRELRARLEPRAGRRPAQIVKGDVTVRPSTPAERQRRSREGGLSRQRANRHRDPLIRS
jgi:hypothetical protein